MSDVYNNADLSMLMADFAVADQLGKLQVVGGGLQVVNRDHSKGVSAAFALVISLTFQPAVFQEQYAFEVVLEETNGNPVELGPQGANGAPSVMRFGQTLTVEEPNLSRAGVPRHALPARSQVVLFFNNGLPLPAGRTLVWRAKIDGQTKDSWAMPFFVPAPTSAPVIG